MNKKIRFGTAPSTAAATAIDDLVRARREPLTAVISGEEVKLAELTKRISADLPLSVHQKLKVHCAQNNILIADFLRNLVVSQFENSN